MKIYESKNLAGDCTKKSVCGRKGYLNFCMENIKTTKKQTQKGQNDELVILL